ncbi:MAG: glycosyltransferase family 4 protein, partial [Thermoanaerobaculia bacterium]
MKVALVHDWLTGTRGGEKVLLELVRMFPGAPVFTLFHFPGSQPPEIEAAEIRTTFLQKLVSPRADYRKLL